MFDRHLPEPLYENLPRLYAAAAFLVALAPLSPLRWIAVAALLLATAVTVGRRRRYRRRHLRRGASTPGPGGLLRFPPSIPQVRPPSRRPA